MLLRTISAPVLKTFMPVPESDLGSPNMPPPRSLSMCMIKRTSLESDVKRLYMSKEKIFYKCKPVLSPVLVKESEEKMVSDGGDSGGAGRRYIGSGGGGEGDGSWGSNGSESLDVYYQNMIRIYPGDALLLANYARFLKEVRGDLQRAEEFCERAILAEASDGNVLSMYGDLIWNNHKDGARAQTYFDQAVQSSPNDCYVLASFAWFLWDAEEEGEEEEDETQKEFRNRSKQSCGMSHILPSGYPPLAAAS